MDGWMVDVALQEIDKMAHIGLFIIIFVGGKGKDLYLSLPALLFLFYFSLPCIHITQKYQPYTD